jgi:hypothetical protein
MFTSQESEHPQHQLPGLCKQVIVPFLRAIPHRCANFFGISVLKYQNHEIFDHFER